MFFLALRVAGVKVRGAFCDERPLLLRRVRYLRLASVCHALEPFPARPAGLTGSA